MKIETLREFCYLAETLNYSTTAKHFYTSHSVLSKHISRLEEELGTKLLLRTSHHVQLTPVGEMFVGHAQAIVDAHDRAIEAVGMALKNTGETLRIGYLPESTQDYMIQGCRLFGKKYPNVDLVFYSSSVSGVLEMLENEEIDIGVGVHLYDLDANRYCCQVIFEDFFGAMVPEDSPLAHKDILLPDDLRGTKIITRRLSSSERPEITTPGLSHFFEDAGLQGNIVEKLADTDSLALMLQLDGRSVGILPSHLAPRYQSVARFVPIQGFNVAIYISAIWQKSRETPALRYFADCLARSQQRTAGHAG